MFGFWASRFCTRFRCECGVNLITNQHNARDTQSTDILAPSDAMRAQCVYRNSGKSPFIPTHHRDDDVGGGGDMNGHGGRAVGKEGWRREKLKTGFAAYTII